MENYDAVLGYFLKGISQQRDPTAYVIVAHYLHGKIVDGGVGWKEWW